jgi:hypothetical protein
MTMRDRSNGGSGPVAESLQPRFGSREERIAYNEARSRSINERRAEQAAGREASLSYRCECWQEDCTARIPLSREEWGMVRAEPTRFAVAPHHVAENFEAVVKAFPRFWVIDKFGQAGEIAEELASSDSRLAHRFA